MTNVASGRSLPTTRRDSTSSSRGQKRMMRKQTSKPSGRILLSDRCMDSILGIRTLSFFFDNVHVRGDTLLHKSRKQTCITQPRTGLLTLHNSLHSSHPLFILLSMHLSKSPAEPPGVRMIAQQPNFSHQYKYVTVDYFPLPIFQSPWNHMLHSLLEIGPERRTWVMNNHRHRR